MNIVTQKAKKRQRIIEYSLKHGKSEASRKYKEPGTTEKWNEVIEWIKDISMIGNISEKLCPPSKNRHKKASKNEMNRSISLIC